MKRCMTAPDLDMKRCILGITCMTAPDRYETVHDSTRLRYETVFIRYTVHDSDRTLDMKVSIRNKVHDSTKPIDMYVTLDTRQE